VQNEQSLVPQCEGGLHTPSHLHTPKRTTRSLRAILKEIQVAHHNAYSIDGFGLHVRRKGLLLARRLIKTSQAHATQD
jgi:hypothetical protein